MFDVVLYRIRDDGRIDLAERRFASLDDLAGFLGSGAGEAWDWAELAAPDVAARRYCAEELRAASGSTPGRGAR